MRREKGERQFRATDHPKEAVTESKEDNDELIVTARCKDAD
jgi:hypothetical protein